MIGETINRLSRILGADPAIMITGAITPGNSAAMAKSATRPFSLVIRTNPHFVAPGTAAVIQNQ